MDDRDRRIILLLKFGSWDNALKELVKHARCGVRDVDYPYPFTDEEAAMVLHETGKSTHYLRIP